MASELHQLTQDLLSKDEALKISEERYRELIESINDIIFTCDLDGTILYISPSVSKISKYVADDFIGRHVSNFIHEDYIDELNEIIQNVKQDLPSKPVIVKTFDKDQTSRYIRISSKFHKHNKEVITGTIVDVTELMLMQRKLELSEQKYKAIVEDQTELIFRALPEGLLTFINTAFCKYFNAQFDQLLSSNFLDLLPQDDQINIIEILKTLTQKNPSAMIVHKANVNGSERYLQSFYRMIFDERNTPLIVQGIARDITNQIKMEQILYRRCSILQSLSDTMEAMVWVKDLDWRYMFASKLLCEKVFGRDDYDVIGSTDADLFQHCQGDTENIADTITLNCNSTCRFYIIYHCKEDEVWLDVKKSTLKDMAGGITGVVSVAFDISSEKDKIKTGLEKRVVSGEAKQINEYVYQLEKV